MPAKKSIEIIIKNQSKIATGDLAVFLEFCTPHELLKTGFTAVFKSGVGFNSWDGTAWQSEKEKERKVEIVIPGTKCFPFVADVNHDFPEFYLREVWLNNQSEFIIWMLVHEQSHLVAFDNPKIITMDPRYKNFIECDEETFCDFTACAKLNSYRRALRKSEEAAE